MDRDSTLTLQVHLGILALCVLAMVTACAGPPAKAATDLDYGRQTVPVADTSTDVGVPPSSGPVAPSAQRPSLQQAPAPGPDQSRGGEEQLIASSNQQPETHPPVSDGSQPKDFGVRPSSGQVALSAQRPSPQQTPAPEPQPAESRGGAKQPTTTGNQKPETNPQVSVGTQPTEYRWQDGDRSQTVILQPDLVIDEGASTKGAEAEAPGGAIVRSADAQGQGTSEPVFKSQSGALMTLPGGVLLVLEPEWTRRRSTPFSPVTASSWKGSRSWATWTTGTSSRPSRVFRRWTWPTP